MRSIHALQESAVLLAGNRPGDATGSEKFWLALCSSSLLLLFNGLITIAVNKQLRADSSPESGSRSSSNNDMNDFAEPETAVEQDPMGELRALNEVVAALQRIPTAAARRRILQTTATFYDVNLDVTTGYSDAGPRPPNASGSHDQTSFSEDRSISPKDFVLQKQPKTDVERVACLAYYLTHYRETPHFKTIDISKLNTEAAQPKFSNTAVTMDNATRSHYLVQASKGNRQLSASGELFVQALPDREAARSAMAAAKPRKRKRASQLISTTEENGAEE